MLVSFMVAIPRQCLRQSFPAATQRPLDSSRALYFAGCMLAPPVPCANASEAEAIAAAAPTAAKSSRRSMEVTSSRAKIIHHGHVIPVQDDFHRQENFCAHTTTLSWMGDCEFMVF